MSFFVQISLGYFLSDLAMILWLFPSLGGKEYVFGPFWTEEFKYVHLQWCGFIPWMAGCEDPFVHLFLHPHVSSFLPGENNISPEVLQSADGTSDDGGDECIMVLENIQGHGKDSFPKTHQ
ncbi:uncharacterized protein LOC135597549 isoform X2 [Musa acuminata AAA Group]|uniref:uncharacterized protein LOC135597549 isoform X2 n=1 Tax=Musa acuminata AAA Group TaxID=214697 RepID=UPI0031DCB735